MTEEKCKKIKTENVKFQQMTNRGNLFGIARQKIIGNYNGIAECCRSFPALQRVVFNGQTST